MRSLEDAVRAETILVMNKQVEKFTSRVIQILTREDRIKFANYVESLRELKNQRNWLVLTGDSALDRIIKKIRGDQIANQAHDEMIETIGILETGGLSELYKINL